MYQKDVQMMCLVLQFSILLTYITTVSLLFHAVFVYKYYFPKTHSIIIVTFPTNFTTVVKYILITDMCI